jgi:succinate dehydrogenase/fumarate reductase-like Fe-S protein
MEEQDVESNLSAIHIGDYILLRTTRISSNSDSHEEFGWLCSEGQLGEDCMLINNQESMQVQLNVNYDLFFFNCKTGLSLGSTHSKSIQCSKRIQGRTKFNW